MSADSHTVCLDCYPELVGREGVTENIAYEMGFNLSVREYHEFYTENGTHVVVKYRAECWDCDWHFEFEHREPIVSK